MQALIDITAQSSRGVSSLKGADVASHQADPKLIKRLHGDLRIAMRASAALAAARKRASAQAAQSMVAKKQEASLRVRAQRNL